jgi:pimeloyl-ACP methyl ester carboxylesterase
MWVSSARCWADGSADAAIPLAKAEELHDGLRGPARLAVVEGGTHASNMSHPAEVSAEMLAFLRNLDPSC